ncbi:MAG: hypothetical protein ACOYWZ_17910 [Bacillota bacterium]
MNNLNGRMSLILILGGIVFFVLFVGVANAFYGDHTESVLNKNFQKLTSYSQVSILGHSQTDNILTGGERLFFSTYLLDETFSKLRRIQTPLGYNRAGNDSMIVRYNDAYVLLQSGSLDGKEGTVIYMAPERQAYRRHYTRFSHYWGGGSLRQGSYGTDPVRGGGIGFGK